MATSVIHYIDYFIKHFLFFTVFLAAMQDGISPRTAGANYLSTPASQSTRTTLMQDDDMKSTANTNACLITGNSSASNGLNSNSSSSNPTSSASTSDNIFDLFELWMKMRADLKGIPGEKFKNIKWMNNPAPPGCAYQPTEVIFEVQIYLKIL